MFELVMWNTFSPKSFTTSIKIKVSESTYQGSQHFPPAFLQMHQTRLTFSHFEMKFIEKYQSKDYCYEAGHKEQKEF